MHNGKVLRTPSGGGTRKLTVDKTCDNKVLCEKGIELFFPDGKSSKGPLVKFTYQVLDYEKVPMPDGLTVGDLYEVTKIGILRFYFSTCNREVTEKEVTETCSTTQQRDSCPESPASGSSSGTPSRSQPGSLPIEDKTVAFGPHHNTPSTSTLEDTSELPDLGICSQLSTTPIEERAFGPNHSTPLTSTLEDSKELPDLDSMIGQIGEDIVAQAMALENIDPSTDMHDMLESIETVHNEAVHEICLHRGRVFEDMITYYKTVSTTMRLEDIPKYEVKMILPDGNTEAGEDNGGLFRDALTEFWDTFYVSCTGGQDIVVPTLVHTMQQEDWKAVAYIIYVGLKQEHFFPHRIALPFIRYCIDENFNICEKELLDSFLQYVTHDESDLLKQALETFEDVDQDELLDVLGCHDVRTAPTTSNIKRILTEVAHKELIQNAAYVADCWRKVFQHGIPTLLTKDIGELIPSITPTVKKVIEILKFPDKMSQEEDEVAKY